MDPAFVPCRRKKETLNNAICINLPDAIGAVATAYLVRSTEATFQSAHRCSAQSQLRHVFPTGTELCRVYLSVT